MASLPIDTAKFTGIICAVPPAPRVANRETGQLRVDRETGKTVYQVGLCLMAGASADVVTVSVAGEPAGVQLGMPGGRAKPGRHPVGERGATWHRVPSGGDPAPQRSRLGGQGGRAVMTLASSTTSADVIGPSWVLVVAAALVSGLLLAGPALRRRYPVAWWLLLGFPAVAFRVVHTGGP